MIQSALSTLDRFYAWHRRRLILWGAAVGSVVAVLGLQAAAPEWQILPDVFGSLSAGTLLAVFLGALLCEYLDSSLGMGYGTTLTPLLLIAGFAPLQIVPAILLSELVSGLSAGALHQRDGNVDFLGDARARGTVLLLTLLSAAGALAAVTLAVTISKFWLTLAITAIVLSMGVLTLLTARRRLPYRRGNVIVIGIVAAFNKGLSGGGYGPLVTSGQVISGVPAKNAVAITSVAEAFTCLVGLTGYLVLNREIDWALTTPLLLGAVLSVPLATVTVKRLPDSLIRGAVGIFTLVLGIVSLSKLLG